MLSCQSDYRFAKNGRGCHAAFQNSARCRLSADCPPQRRSSRRFAIARKLAQLIYRLLIFGQDYIDIGDATDRIRSPPTDDRRCVIRRMANSFAVAVAGVG